MLSQLTIIVPTLPKSYSDHWLIQLKKYLHDGARVIISLFSHKELDPHNPLVHLKATYPNLIIYYAQTKGQVYQRSEAMALSSTDFTLLLDDDIYITPGNITRLLNYYVTEIPVKSALAPRLIAKDSPKQLQKNPSSNSLASIARTLLTGIVHGCNPFNISAYYGKVLPSCTGLTYPQDYLSDSPLPAEWLPGGCILMPTRYLPKSHCQQYSDKAYNEDLFMSLELRKSNVMMFYHPSVYAMTPLPPDVSTLSFKAGLTQALLSHKSRYIYCKKTNSSVFRLYAFLIYDLIRISLRICLSK